MKVILLLTMCLSLFACGNKNTKENKSQEKQSQKDHVEVLYFHGKQRCITCAAIEKNTKEVVESQFADELENGTLVFKSIDISQSENEEITNKYEVTWSSLFITKMERGKGHHGKPDRIRLCKGILRPRHIQNKRDTKDSATTKINIYGMVTISIG